MYVTGWCCSWVLKAGAAATVYVLGEQESTVHITQAIPIRPSRSHTNDSAEVSKMCKITRSVLTGDQVFGFHDGVSIL